MLLAYARSAAAQHAQRWCNKQDCAFNTNLNLFSLVTKNLSSSSCPMILVSENDITLTKASPPSDGQTVSQLVILHVTYISSNIQIDPPPIYVASLPLHHTSASTVTPKPTNYLCINTDKTIKGHYVIVSSIFLSQ